MCMMSRAAPSVMRGWGAWRRCQAVQRTVQNNGNLKSEPKYGLGLGLGLGFLKQESSIHAFYF